MGLQKQLGSDGKDCDSVEAALRIQGCVVQGYKSSSSFAKGLAHFLELLATFALARKAAAG